MSSKSQHVVPKGRMWAVQKSGAAKVTRTFPTQQEAIVEGQKIARNQGTELYIHRQDGRIRDRVSYGSDPVKSKG